MELHLVGRNHLTLTDAIKDYATKKITPINTMFQHITTVNVVFHIENLDHYASATIHMNGHIVNASEKGKDIYEAIDRLSDNLYAQLTKIKERNIDSHH